VIKRICQKEGSNLLVVTSDRDLASYAERCGAVTVDSEEFEGKVEMALYLGSKGADAEDEKEGWTPGKGTRKKGPARRLSKKERKKREKWRKL
jgi:predicted RNA-binding protein with PIN domain